MTAAHEVGNLSLARRLDQAANPFAMTDLRAKPEIVRGRLDIEWTPGGLCFAAIDLETHWLARRSRSRRDVVGGDFFRMRDEIAEGLPAGWEAGLGRRA